MQAGFLACGVDSQPNFFPLDQKLEECALRIKSLFVTLFVGIVICLIGSLRTCWFFLRFDM